MLVLDTNIVIAYFAEEEKVVHALEDALESGEELIVPTIVKAETLSYSDIDPVVLERIRAWFKETRLVTLDSMIAERTADIRRATKLKLIDSIIAATALSMQAKLVTRDTDFTRVVELEIMEW